MARPAFDTFFFAESFQYLTQYRARGEFLTALLSPTDGIFFRPVFFAASLPWHFILPPDPWWFHLRNLALSAVNLFLLYVLLTRLVAAAAARAVAFTAFVVSKVHLTTIGYINIVDSIVMLGLLLLTLIAWLRFADHPGRGAYALALLATTLAVFTKDYALVVVLVVAALAVVHPRLEPAGQPGAVAAARSWHWWAPRLAPLALIVTVYLLVRAAVVGPPSAANAVYAPQLAVEVVARKLLLFAATAANLSLDPDPGVAGARGLTGAIDRGDPGRASLAVGVEVGLFVAWLALLGLTLRLGVVRRGVALLLPVTWIAAYLGPTLLTRNVQLYYQYEALAGLGVLIGMCLDPVAAPLWDRSVRRCMAAWVVALGVIAVNGAVSNATSLYHWQFVANAARDVERPILDRYRGQPLESLTLVTRTPDYWQFVLQAGGALIPELLGQPGLRVAIVPPDGLSALDPADALNPVHDADNGFVRLGEPLPPPRLLGVFPARTRAGIGFNVQPGGESALAVTAGNISRRTIIVFGGRPLATTFGGAGYLTALVPPALIAAPGRYEVVLRDPAGESEPLEFEVEE